jgi:amino acid adenylation domain-containing protein
MIADRMRETTEHTPTSRGSGADADSLPALSQRLLETACFHELFEAQAARVPHRTALVCGDTELSYAALNAAANRLAHHLRRAGVGPGRCVALCLERSADMIVALLGILKAGGAYVPLLPDAPKARLSHQLTETEAPVVLTQASLTHALPETSAAVVCLDRDRALLEKEASDNPAPLAKPSDIVYVIYTSGSTGLPKGVAVRHENLVNYTLYLIERIRARDFDDQGGLSYATVSTLAADLGNTCIFPALASGGTLHVITHEMALDGDLFGAYARDKRIDVLKITPSHLGALLAAQSGKDVLPRRVLVTGGEASTWGLVDRVRGMASLRWINHYGPTETTIGSLTFDLEEADAIRHIAATVPIGRAIAGTDLHILDENGAPVADGEPGELYIGGRGVTAGYLKQPERTAERFLPNRFSGEAGARMYRTGDRVRMLPNGAIEFLGRVDFQVKIRGYRVELGEIEAVLRGHPGVREVIVVAREVRPQDLRIVAYVVPAAEAFSVDELRKLAREKLPDHMVPTAFTTLAALPLTPNGKVDRKALPDPFASAPSDKAEPEAASFKGPLGSESLEEQIAEVWRGLLGLPAVGLDDNFFEIGGHSLAAIHMLAELHKRTGKRLPNTVLFQAPTIRGMAEALRRAGATPLFRSLVAIQPKGKRSPIFCVHGGGGHVFWYKDLARRLGEDQPFYGLQCRIEDDGRVRTNRVEDMAHYYLEEVRAAFPRGPYYLSGASFGGKVAYEMARRLREQGETVALLAMFDTWGPGYPSDDPNATRFGKLADGVYQRLDHHLGALWMLERGQRTRYVKEKLNYGYMEALGTIEVLAMEVQRWTYRARGRADSIPKDLQESPGFIKEASDAYDPPPYDGDVLLFRSKLQPPGTAYDESLGWSKVVRGKLTIQELPGMHATMVTEPRVRFLVDALRPHLEAAQARHG